MLRGELQQGVSLLRPAQAGRDPSLQPMQPGRLVRVASFVDDFADLPRQPGRGLEPAPPGAGGGEIEPRHVEEPRVALVLDERDCAGEGPDGAFVIAEDFESMPLLDKNAPRVVAHRDRLVEEREGLVELALGPAEGGFDAEQPAGVEHVAGVPPGLPKLFRRLDSGSGLLELSRDPQDVRRVGRGVAQDAAAPAFRALDPLGDCHGETGQGGRLVEVAGGGLHSRRADPLHQPPGPAFPAVADDRQALLLGHLFEDGPELVGVPAGGFELAGLRVVVERRKVARQAGAFDEGPAQQVARLAEAALDLFLLRVGQIPGLAQAREIGETAVDDLHLGRPARRRGEQRCEMPVGDLPAGEDLGHPFPAQAEPGPELLEIQAIPEGQEPDHQRAEATHHALLSSKWTAVFTWSALQDLPSRNSPGAVALAV